MNLQTLRGSYNLIAGLGSWCGPALYSERHNLRRHSFPLDWVQTPFLSDVNRLLKNKFQGFMELENMIEKDILANYIDDNGYPIFKFGTHEPVRAHYVTDTQYNIDSVHDFPIIPDQAWVLQYPPYKIRLVHRIQTFLNQIAQSQRTLFIRHEWMPTSYEDIVILKSILAEMTDGNFNILLIETVDDDLQGVKDMNFGTAEDGICWVQVSRKNGINPSIWNILLEGITLID
ncbi:DUF1796 family putative cysteine peptidase [Priestia megaterium]|uniref:DUF1796 family putative cysteine peptidase n=2 Tax=Priestia megaterium TaxID=1404 RepID=UPI000BF9E33E|nr:DUF1796 family putative cysteine peptidase [Priestia megaterium]PEW13217.1 peptidase [Priestia megaterium]PEZ50721.1 peptidase [Priestia megaterium]PFL71516.1 peptidase [Priestia megaterium]PFP14689.1 peptidase [Priestia megaterium]PFU63639.1 peptidase [Priestia megaterium]